LLLSQEDFGSIEEIERAICDNPSKLSDIQSACPNRKEHILYAYRRNDTDGAREALENVRDSIMNLQMIKESYKVRGPSQYNLTGYEPKIFQQLI